MNTLTILALCALILSSCGLGITTPPITVPSFTIPPITLKPDAKAHKEVQP